MAKFGIGQPMRRMEDGRFLTGAGRYVADVDLPRQLHGLFLRSPHAHATIKRIDVSAARTMPGVALVATAADMKELGGISADAGLKIGDELIDVDDRSTDNMAPTALRDALSQPGQTRRLRVLRGDQVMRVSLLLRKRL